MKTILGLLFISIIALTSCEGKRTQQQALSDSIAKFKKTVNLETNVYIPETYTESEVDTVMSNGFRVKIKTYSDMTNSVQFSKIKDTINYQTHYRNFKFEISVSKDKKIIYSENFDKQKVNKVFNYRSDLASGSDLSDFDKLAVLKSIQVNDDPSYTNRVVIDVLYTIPESDRFASHRLFIDAKGKMHVVQSEIK